MRKRLLCVGNGLGLTLASKNTSTDSFADTDTETASNSDDEGSDQDLEHESLLLAHAAPPCVDAIAPARSGSSALGSFGLILVTECLLGGPHCAFFGAAVEAQS